jgi:hypothetical protein
LQPQVLVGGADCRNATHATGSLEQHRLITCILAAGTTSAMLIFCLDQFSFDPRASRPFSLYCGAPVQRIAP